MESDGIRWNLMEFDGIRWNLMEFDQMDSSGSAVGATEEEDLRAEVTFLSATSALIHLMVTIVTTCANQGF